MLIELKRRRNQAPVPVLFLTRRPALLIEAAVAPSAPAADNAAPPAQG